MKIPFPEKQRREYYRLLDQVFDSNFWSEGAMSRRFEEDFADFAGIPAVAVSSGGGALLALLEYANVRGRDVIIPANTFHATAVAARMAGANVVYADCSRDDLCLSLETLKAAMTDNTAAVCVVHIGGHIAFDIERIATFCEKRGIALIEDCAHAHGASFKGRTAGSWGLGGAYSFYATKTMPLGDGGMVVSRDSNLAKWAKLFRNYGKRVDNGKVHYDIPNGFNFRMNEVTAALGIVQLRRLPEILDWKRMLAEKYDTIFERRVEFPDGMVSGYYKYIVFDYELREGTGKVFAQSDLGPEIEDVPYDLPNSRWISQHHACPPIWFGWEHADEPFERLREILLG